MFMQSFLTILSKGGNNSARSPVIHRTGAFYSARLHFVSYISRTFIHFYTAFYANRNPSFPFWQEVMGFFLLICPCTVVYSWPLCGWCVSFYPAWCFSLYVTALALTGVLLSWSWSNAACRINHVETLLKAVFINNSRPVGTSFGQALMMQCHKKEPTDNSLPPEEDCV